MRIANLALRYAVLLNVVLAFSVMRSLVRPVRAEIMVRQKTHRATTTWGATTCLISAPLGTPLLGRLGDGFGRRRTLVLCRAPLAIGSLVAGLSRFIGVLSLARVAQRAGGGVPALSFGIVHDDFLDVVSTWLLRGRS